MSGSLIGGVIGATIGYFVTGGTPMGAIEGFAIGSGIGGLLLPPDLPTQYGPRLQDLKAQTSEYGSAIPIIYGTVALQGTVIWSADIKEVQTTQSQGGKGGSTQTSVSYSYFGSFAVAVCEGPIKGVLRIWAGPEKRLIYDTARMEGGTLRVYLGDETQAPDPAIEADIGVGLVPAYRGTAYIVIEDFPLAKDGNMIPFLTIEVSSAQDGGMCGVNYTVVGTGTDARRVYDTPPVKLGSYDNTLSLSGGAHPTAVDNAGNVYMLIVSHATGTYKWFIKKVSSTAPIAEESLYLGAQFDSILDCSMAYDPTTNRIGIVQEATTNYLLLDCGTFVGAYAVLALAKRDIIYRPGGFRMLDAFTSFSNGVLSADCYGIATTRENTGVLVDCGDYGIAVADYSTYLNGAVIAPNKTLDIYDPVRKRLLGVIGTTAAYTGYYDFSSGVVITPEDMTPSNTVFRLHPVYFPALDRIVFTDGGGMGVANPGSFTALSFPDECNLFSGVMEYQDGSIVNNSGQTGVPVVLPNMPDRIAVVPTSAFNFSGNGNDIFTFPIGARGGPVTLADIVADLSERAGESRYDVSQLAGDMVDGYIIARQTEVRAALDPLRSAYYFDAVESQGLIRFVKRGGAVAAVIPDEDLAAHEPGSEPPDPLQTSRRMENELPRAMTVKYLQAATAYEQATRQARRLIGSSGDEKTVEVPLVLSDTKAQEVAEVLLHSAWGERLAYEFTLPRKYSYLEPTDLILVKSHLMRLTTIKATAHGLLQCNALSDESAYYSPHVVVTETPGTGGTVATPAFTSLELF